MKTATVAVIISICLCACAIGCTSCGVALKTDDCKKRTSACHIGCVCAAVVCFLCFLITAVYI